MLKIISLVSLLLLVSCGSVSTSRYREGDNRGQSSDLTVEDEKRMTAEYLEQMKKDYPPVKDSKVQQYIRKLGQRLVAASNLEGKPYHYTFTVVDVDYVNAFALPAGTIYVTKPLIEMTENEAELAGVVGHEIGHVMARHTAERMTKQKRDQKKNILQTIGGGLLGGAVGYGAGKLLCRKGDKKCLAKATVGGAGVGAVGTLLVQKYKFMQNSQEDEMEADRIGFRTAVKAGFSKDHVGKFYEKLLEMEKKHGGGNSGLMKKFSDAMSTHPPSEKRIRQMNQMAAEYRGAKGIQSTKSYKWVKGRLK